MSDPCRLSTEFGLFPLTREETSTVESMLGPEQTKITLMPTHHINGLGDMMGFKFECASFLPGSCIPLVRTLFHGHTLVECQASEDQIMRLMSQPDVNRQLMLEFLRGLDEECVPAGLECIPENASAVTASGMVQATGLRSVDRYSCFSLPLTVICEPDQRVGRAASTGPPRCPSASASTTRTSGASTGTSGRTGCSSCARAG